MKSHKYAHIEEERRYLLAGLPADLDPAAGYTHIHDRYLTGTRLRLRRMASPDGETLALKLTQKYRDADQPPHATTITNIYLTQEEYALFAPLPARDLIKRRYPYLHGAHTYSLDVFTGPLTGLILGEIENRPGLVSAADHPVPAFAVRDVTADPFFTGGNLVNVTAAELQEKLAVALR